MKLVVIITVIAVIGIAYFFFTKDKKPSRKELSAEEKKALSLMKREAQAMADPDSEGDKLICKYCGSHVDEGNEVCPNCGASLEDAIQAANMKKAIENLRELNTQLKAEEEQEKEEKREKMEDAVKMAAISTVAPITGRYIYKKIKRKK